MNNSIKLNSIPMSFSNMAKKAISKKFDILTDPKNYRINHSPEHLKECLKAVLRPVEVIAQVDLNDLTKCFDGDLYHVAGLSDYIFSFVKSSYHENTMPGQSMCNIEPFCNFQAFAEIEKINNEINIVYEGMHAMEL